MLLGFISLFFYRKIGNQIRHDFMARFLFLRVLSFITEHISSCNRDPTVCKRTQALTRSWIKMVLNLVTCSTDIFLQALYRVYVHVIHKLSPELCSTFHECLWISKFHTMDWSGRTQVLFIFQAHRVCPGLYSVRTNKLFFPSSKGIIRNGSLRT